MKLTHTTPEEFYQWSLPEWATGTADGELVLGAQLPSRDGRRCGNAHIIGLMMPPELVTESNPQQYHVLTDAGTTMKLTANEVDELFHPPKWVSDVNEVKRKFGGVAKEMVIDWSKPFHEIRQDLQEHIYVRHPAQLSPTNLSLIEEAGKAFADSFGLRDVPMGIPIYDEQFMQIYDRAVKDLEQRLADTEHELALLMNTYHLYPWCCKAAGSSNGWNHNRDCKNWVPVF